MTGLGKLLWICVIPGRTWESANPDRHPKGQLLHMGRPQLEEQRIEPVEWEAGDADGLWWVLKPALFVQHLQAYFPVENWIVSS